MGTDKESERYTGDMGGRIKLLREARGLSQPALARLLVSLGAPASITKTTVAKWENGDTKNIQNLTMFILTKALATDHAFLLFGPDREPPSDPTATGRFRKLG